MTKSDKVALRILIGIGIVLAWVAYKNWGTVKRAFTTTSTTVPVKQQKQPEVDPRVRAMPNQPSGSPSDTQLRDIKQSEKK